MPHPTTPKVDVLTNLNPLFPNDDSTKVIAFVAILILKKKIRTKDIVLMFSYVKEIYLPMLRFPYRDHTLTK